MLFDTYPKTSMDEVFGRKAEYLELVDKIENNRKLFIITGPRRIGKTTFLYASLNELHKDYSIPYIVIDARAVFNVNAKAPHDIIAREIVNAVNRESKIRGIVSKIEGVSLSGFGVRLRDEKPTLPQVLQDLNESNELLILAFDEVQYLRFANDDFTKILAWIYDTLKNVVLILTGSQVGVLEKFLRLYDYKALLYGRYHVRIKLNRFNPSESLEFLEQGFKEYGMSIPSKELLSAIKSLDGVAGWLTHYGAYRVDGYNHEDAINEVINEASGYIEAEFAELDELSPRYRAMLKIVANITSTKETATWTEIKEALELQERTKIAKADIQRYLKKLVDYNFLEHVGYGEYKISDPVIKRVFQSRGGV